MIRNAILLTIGLEKVRKNACIGPGQGGVHLAFFNGGGAPRIFPLPQFLAGPPGIRPLGV